MEDIGKDVSTKDGGAVTMALSDEISKRNSSPTPQKQDNGTSAVKKIEKAAALRQAHINVGDAALSLDSTLSNLSGSAGSAGGISSFLEHAKTQRRMAVETGKIMRKSRSHAVSTDLQRWRKEMEERHRLERCKSRLVVAWLAWYDVYQTSKSNALKALLSTIRWKKLLYAAQPVAEAKGQEEDARVVTGHTGAVLSVCFDHTGEKLASGTGDESVRLWTTESGAPIGSPLNVDSSVKSISYSPSGDTLAVGCYIGNVLLVDAVTVVVKRSLTGHRYRRKF
jgi:WD40 repeat protein